MPEPQPEPDPRPLIVLYDAMCGACRAGARRLETLDAGRGRLDLRDLHEHADLIQAHAIEPAEARRVMHAITPEGEVLTAMDALRATLDAVGRGWLLAWTRLPLIRPLADACYRLIARHRHTLFGTPRA